MKKRILSLLLCIVMVLSLLPTVAFADGETPPTGAVAYVTTGEGDAAAPIQASDYDNEATTEVVEEAGYFKTLKSAINAVPKDNAEYTITMVDDFTYEQATAGTYVSIVAKQNITLDLNGKMIQWVFTEPASSGWYIFIRNDGILTLKDNSDTNCDGTGEGLFLNCRDEDLASDDFITYGSLPAVGMIRSGGTVNVLSGHYKNEINGGASYVLDGDGSSKINIHGGHLESTYSNTLRLFCGTQTLNMDGGIVGSEVGPGGIMAQSSASTINISGGLVQCYGDSHYALFDYEDGYAKNTFNITGGEFVNYATKKPGSFYTYGSNVKVTDGKFVGTFAVQNGPDTEIAISGGTFVGQVTSSGKYATKGFITGGNFTNIKNYDDVNTLYEKNNQVYFKKRVATRMDESTKGKKCLQDYLDAGFIVNCSYGTSVYDSVTGKLIDVDVFDVYTSNGMTVVDTLYSAPVKASWNLTQAEKDAYLYSVKEVYEQDAAEYRFRDYSGYTKGYINWAITNYGAGLTITQEDYDNTIFKSGYDWSYTDCKDLAILNDRVYRGYVSWGGGSDYYGTEQKPGPWAYQQSKGTIQAWEDSGYTTEYKGMEGTYKVYYAYKTLGGNKLIAEGYVDKINAENPNTYDVVPVEVNLGKAKVVEDKIEVKGEEIEVKYNGEDVSTGAEGQPTIVEAADAITETLQNSSVSGFLDTKIDDSTKTNDEAIKSRMIEQIATEDEEIREALTAAIGEATINSETETKYDKRVDVDLKVADVIKTTTVEASASAATTLKVAVFDVQPNAKVTVKLTNTDTGEVITERTYETPIKNEEITDAISFRVPVNYKESAHAVKVWHKEKDQGIPVAGQEETYGESQGLKFVQTAANGDKFVQLESDHFSYWTYEIVDVEANAVVVILDEEGNYRSFESLAEAVADWKSAENEDDVTMILMQDVGGADFDSKEIALDLNGHYLTGAVEKADKVTVSNADSSNQHTLAATGVYANDVSDFVADGYDVKTTTVENDTIFSTTEAGVYTVEVEATANQDDRDASADGIDLFAGDTVTVTVKVNGARFVAADVTLNFDPDLFEIEDSPATMWEEGDNYFRFYNAKSGGGYWGDGHVLGTFTFKAKAQTENVTGNFTVGSDTVKTYVSGAWSEGWNTGDANALSEEEITNDSARIILKNMTASVTPINGQSYKATELKLLQPGYSAVDSTTGKAITDATITYAYLTKAEVEGTLVEGKTDEYVEGKEPKVPAGTAYTSTIPAPVNAGDYVVFYKVDKDGYVTVADKINVSIDKAETTITWKATGFSKVNEGVTKDHAGNNVTEDYYKEYADTAAALPVAEYDCLETNQKGNATVTITTPVDATELKSVGSYTVTASLSDNYKILNPTCTLLIDGALIKGYDLQNTTEGEQVWYDDSDHTVAQLVKDTTLVPPEENVTIKYSLNGGAWQDTIPNVKEVGKYELKMKITADSYYDFTDTVNFEIKNVEYKVEKTDYVTGWDLVLVYTNDAVPGFKYDMGGETGLVNTYNVSDLGYEHGTVWNAAGTAVTTTGTHYNYVYAIVVFGDADITKVVPSNKASITIDRTNTKNRYDVNNSNTVDINDLVAVQGTYNVGSDYLNDEQMSIVLRADVSGNKKVDTYDCSLIKLNSGSIS